MRVLDWKLVSTNGIIDFFCQNQAEANSFIQTQFRRVSRIAIFRADFKCGQSVCFAKNADCLFSNDLNGLNKFILLIDGRNGHEGQQ